jgi:hypothetical protein
MKQEFVDLAWIFFTLVGIACVAGGWRSGKMLAVSAASLSVAIALWRFIGIQ